MKWEYRKDYGENYNAERLNKIGADDWELVAVCYSHEDHDGNKRFYYYFKRPIPEPTLAPPPINK